MIQRTHMPSQTPRVPGARNLVDPFAAFFDATMPGGTSLIGPLVVGNTLPMQTANNYLSTWADVIFEYERTLADLRRELLHYKRLVGHLLGPGEMKEEYQLADAVIPIDDASIRVVNSIVRANVPPSATFRDFNDEEL